MRISATLRFDDDAMWVTLKDGRVLGVPLAWFPRLLHASPDERTAVTLSPSGLHWEALDEDISIAGLLAGRGDASRLGEVVDVAGRGFAVKLSYDPKANVAYIRFRAGQGDVETIELTSDFLVDIDETGAVCGIELLNANEQLTAGDDGKLIFVNHLTGGQGELKVA